MGFFSKKQEIEIVDVYNNNMFDGFKRFLHLYMVDGDTCLIKLHSQNASINKGLFDAPIIHEIPKNKTYYDAFKEAYKMYTGVEYKDEKSHMGNRDIVEPKVIIDSKHKVLTYILFVKNCEKVNVTKIMDDKFILDYVNINDFLNTVYTTKFVNYGEAYREFVVFSVSQLFNIGDYIKTLKYTSNQEG